MDVPKISAEARALVTHSDVIDLHIDTFIPVRLFGYDIRARHDAGRGHFFGHLDLPRIREGGLSGAMWSITTNPFRSALGRFRTLERNLVRMRALVQASAPCMTIVKTRSQYHAARVSGQHACLLAIQGGNCLDAAAERIAPLEDGLITRVTLIHLTNSDLGVSSSPFSRFRSKKGLTTKGRALVARLNQVRTFVDLAHIHPQGFWDAVEVHDRAQPLLVTHTGVSGVRPHWRNLDDRQIKAIAQTGGTIGIIFAQIFLQSKTGPKDAQMVLEHMAHIIRVAGEDFVSIGSDYDGAISPPPALRTHQGYSELVQCMLNRGWSDVRIRKILGGNFLRAFGQLRPS